MNTRPVDKSAGEGADIHEQASAWFLALQKDDVPPETRSEFQAWLNQNEAHAEAFADVRAAWDTVESAAAAPEIVTARRDALSRARRAARLRWGRERWPRFAAIAATFIAVILAAPVVLNGPGGISPFAGRARHYQTDIGETRVLTLADNSKISLDAKTALTVRYTRESRLINLEAGQAYFDVAKDPTRPFRVTAGGKTVVALGTAFNVEIVKDKVLVTLVEGKVAVTDAIDEKTTGVPDPRTPALSPAIQELAPGQRLVATASGTAEVQAAADITKTTAWRRGKLIFEDEPLALAIERMNRYSRISLVAGDDGVASLGVSGVFDAGDTEAFVEALEVYFGAQVTKRADGAIVIHAPT